MVDPMIITSTGPDAGHTTATVSTPNCAGRAQNNRNVIVFLVKLHRIDYKAAKKVNFHIDTIDKPFKNI